jgi:hypothetical protein
MGTPIEPTGEVQGGEPTGSETPGHNPAWDEVLSVLPEQFHSVVTPHFQKWDQSAQQRIESANSQLSQFEAYKPFAEHGISTDELERGLRLYYEINNNPENVYKALQNAYNFGQPETPNPQGNEGEEEENPLNLPPEIMEKINNHDGMLQAVAQIVLNDAQAKEAAAADAELDKELKGLQEKFGDYDEDYVMTKMMSGMSGEEAVQSYQSLVQRVTPQPFAPTLLGSNGGGTGLPSNAIDPTKLSGKETRNLVAEMLAAAQKQQ